MQNFEDWAAGPGSYNLTSDISTQSFIYHNAPRAVFSRDRKTPQVERSQNNIYQGLNSPTSSCSPNLDILHKSSSGISFCKSKRPNYFLSGSGRSPGPIYLLSTKSSKGCSFTKAGKLKYSLPEGPSPASYEPRKSPSKIAIKIKGPVSDKIYSKNLEKYYKGQLGPGPGGYNGQESLSKGIVISKSVRKFDLIQGNSSPGPGSYNLVEKSMRKSGHKFPESKKKLDIRACNGYLDRNSFEIWK